MKKKKEFKTSSCLKSQLKLISQMNPYSTVNVRLIEDFRIRGEYLHLTI